MNTERDGVLVTSAGPEAATVEAGLLPNTSIFLSFILLNRIGRHGEISWPAPVIHQCLRLGGCVCSFMFMCVCVPELVCICVYVQTCICVCVYMCTPPRVCVCGHVCVSISACVSVCVWRG